MAIENGDRWKWRRLMVFGSSGFIGALTAYLSIFGEGDNAVQLMAIQSVPMVGAAIIMTYIGAPVADDWLQLRVNKS